MTSQPPIVYVTEEICWEYKELVRRLGEGEPPTEPELNRLGADGWELAGMFTDGSLVHFYFKRRVN